MRRRNKQNIAVRIPRIDNFLHRVNIRRKFLQGKDVRLGKDYSGWATVTGFDENGDRYEGTCCPLRYENEKLYVLEKNTGGLIILTGDIADCKGGLIADAHKLHYDIHELRRKVDTYMAKNEISEYSPEVGKHALWMKGPWASGQLLERVRVYEMTRNLML